MMKGQYEHAVRKNEELIWSKKNGEYIAQILIVSIFILPRIDLIILYLEHI